MEVTPTKDMEGSGGQGDSEASTSYNSSPGAATQAEENFGVDSTGAQRSPEALLQEAAEASGPKDSATRVILNLCSIAQKNGGQIGLPRLVTREMHSIDENGEAVQKSWDPFREAERLRQELATARTEMQRVKQTITEESDLRLQQVMLRSKLQEVERREAEMQRHSRELEDRAKREHEVSSLQRHIFEVEMKRCQDELQQSRSKIEALERELKQAQKSKQRKAEGYAKTSGPSSQEAVRRHEIAVRASFEECREKTSPSRRSSNEDASQGWLACCSVQAAPKKRV